MSNKIVPGIYRAVIDDVIAAIKPEFDEYGVGEDVLAELQQKWEQKVIASGVAEFEPPAAPPPPLPTHAYPLHPLLPGVGGPSLAAYPAAGPYAAALASVTAAAAASAGAAPGATNVKVEPMDPRYPLVSYQLPPLPGPQLGGPGGVARPGAPPGPPVLQYAPAPQGMNGQVRPPPGTQPQTTPRYQPPAGSAIPQTDGPSGGIPQVDGPSSSSSDDEPSYAPPRANHPSLPQPAQASSSAVPDDEAINSDLDDSDDEEGDDDDGAAGATKDLVFCTYDKVARVRNKWKCVLKDGMIHINGKDYLFSKCTGEFEW